MAVYKLTCTVAPVISSVLREGPYNASVSVSIPEIPESLEISLFLANGSSAFDEV